eukprot:jgi/Mesen1/8681/ME000051S08082
MLAIEDQRVVALLFLYSCTMRTTFSYLKSARTILMLAEHELAAQSTRQHQDRVLFKTHMPVYNFVLVGGYRTGPRRCTPSPPPPLLPCLPLLCAFAPLATLCSLIFGTSHTHLLNNSHLKKPCRVMHWTCCNSSCWDYVGTSCTHMYECAACPRVCIGFYTFCGPYGTHM